MSDATIEQAIRTAKSSQDWNDWRQASRRLYRSGRILEGSEMLAEAAALLLCLVKQANAK